MVNLLLSEGSFPSHFKSVLVFLLLKKSTLNKGSVKGYRPVPNLSFLFKVLGKVVMNQLNSHINSSNASTSSPRHTWFTFIFIYYIYIYYIYIHIHIYIYSYQENLPLVGHWDCHNSDCLPVASTTEICSLLPCRWYHIRMNSMIG